MPIWEPLFVAVSGGRRHERARALEALVTALGRCDIRAATLESARKRERGRLPRPFWEYDVVLVEGFARSDLPQIILGRQRTPGVSSRVLAALDPTHLESEALEAVARRIEQLLFSRPLAQPSPRTP